MTEKNRQLDQAITDGFDRDLHPNNMAGQNIGPISDASQRSLRSAYDVKTVHRALRDWPDDELKEVPVLAEGTPLQQGATYINLREPERGEFTAMGGMMAGPADAFVPKDHVPYPTWNRLRGVDDPDRTGSDPHRNG